MIFDVGQLSIMQKSNGTTRQNTTMVQRGTTQHHTTRHYATINSLRSSHIVRRSDNDDTDVRQLGIILQLTDEGYCKGKGFANDIDVGQLSISKVKWDDEAIYNNGTERDDSASYDKALCNNQLDEAWDGTRKLSCRGLVNEA